MPPFLAQIHGKGRKIIALWVIGAESRFCSGVRCLYTVSRDLPENVSRFLHAFGKPAEKLRKDAARNAHADERSFKLIACPWEYDEGVVDETREVTFLRDFFNIFHECMQSCETLDVVGVLVRQTLSTTPAEHSSAVITFWNESYLNEVYIFQLRVYDLLTYVERKYKRDKDFSEPVVAVCASLRKFVNDQLSAIISARGTHVHQHRHRRNDPELGRLAIVNTYVVALDRKDLIPERDKAIDKARTWLLTQVDHFCATCWATLDGVCSVLAEGIITENDWVIVPLPFKDDPSPFTGTST